MSQKSQSHDLNESFKLPFEEQIQSTPFNYIESHENLEVVKLYSVLLDNYNSKHVENERLEKENKILRAANHQLIEGKDSLQRRHADQENFLAYYAQLFDRIRQELMNVMRGWEGFST